MPRFLSPEWLAALEAAAAADAGLREAAAELDLAVRQVVHGAPGGDVSYTIRLGGGGVTVAPDGDAGDLEVTSDYATAAAISQGRLTAAAAFATGRLKIGGRVSTVAGHAGVLARLGDTFALLRATTEY